MGRVLTHNWTLESKFGSILSRIVSITHDACILGEYGIVYKGFLVESLGGIVTELVAIKTLKG